MTLWWRGRLLRVPIKLSLALIAGGFVIFGVYGVYELRAERNALRAVIEQETKLLGRSFRVAVENALRDQQVTAVEEMVRGLEHIDPLVDILIYEPGGRLIASAHGSQSSDPLPESIVQRAISSREEIFLFSPVDDPDRVVFSTPLRSDDGSLFGKLLVVRSLRDMQRALQESRRSITVSVLLFVLTTSVLGLVLGAVYIGRPLDRMAAAMREVRSGNLMSVLPIARRDEMGAIATEFNAMVTELREARHRLDEEAESRARLQRALQEADKLITVGQLSAGLAHEIGSPLQILNGRARALLTHAQDPAETRRNAEILVSQTDRITRIVEQLLRFTRRRPVSIAKTDLHTTVNAVLDLLQYEARRRGVSLRFSGGPGLPPILIDADGIQQIVLNLVANALTATSREGSVSVSLETSRLSTINGGCEVPAVRLIVADTGGGMSTEVLGRLFEPFFTTRSAEGGTGLGLAVVKSITTEHSGAVSVESQLGAGSRFIVDLPVHGAAARREA
jgi:signal transduction histidine kinase